MMKSMLLGCWMGLALPLWAQSVPATDPLSTKASVAKRNVRVKAARKVVAAPVAMTSEALSEAQLAVADKVVVGKIPCELATHVTITPDSRTAGRFILEIGRAKHVMVPVPTSTGAVRLEEAKSGAVWLQLANKSMLMNQKLGKRLADACMNADQLRVAQAMERSPAPNLLEPLAAEAAPLEHGKDEVPPALVSATN